MKVAFLVMACLFSAAPAAAADDPICADRPGQSTPTCTVDPGQWQIETGIADWSMQQSGGERATSLSLGETLVRLGLAKRSEIQVDVTPWQRTTERSVTSHDRASGFGDVQISYLHRATATGAPVQIAIMPTIKMPTANHHLGNGKWEAGLRAPVDFDIKGSSLSLNLTPEIDWTADADGAGHHASMVQVASLGWQADDKFSLSAEVWGQWDWDPSGTSRQASVDGSVAYLVNKDFQLDTGANVGLNRQTPDIELYAGIAKRF